MKLRKHLLGRMLMGLLLLAVVFSSWGNTALATGTPEVLNESDFIIVNGVATGLAAGVAARITGSAVVIADNISALHTLGSGVFTGVNAISEITLGAGITTVEANALRNKGLSKLTFNEAGLSVGNFAFEGNDIASIEGTGSFASLGTSAFQNNNLTNLNLTATTVGARAFAGNNLASIAIQHADAIATGAFADNYSLQTVDVNMVDPPSTLFAAGAFGTLAKTPPIVVNIDQNANGIVSSEPTVYLVNPVRLTIEHRDISAGTPGTLIEAEVIVEPEADLPTSYTAPNKPGYSLETPNPVNIDHSQIVNRELTVVVEYKALGNPIISVSPSKQLNFPTTEPAFDAQKILRDVTFYDINSNVIPAFVGGVLDSRISLTPNSIPAGTSPRTVNVVVTLKAYPDNAVPPGESNQSTSTTLTFTFQSVNITDEEIVPGKGWKYSDFTYSGATVTGLSAAGIAKLASNPDMVLPDKNPTTGANITAIGANAFQNRSINSVDFDKMTALQSIGANAFQNSQLNGVLNIDKATGLSTLGDYAFENNNLSAFDFQALPGLQSIGSYAFQNNKLNAIDLTNLPALQSIGSYAFNNNKLASLQLENNTALSTIGSNAFSNNEIAFVAFENLPELTQIAANLFAGNKINAVELDNLPKVSNIASGSFSNNQIASLSISNMPLLAQINEAFNGNQLTSLELRDLPALQTLGGFADNQIASLNLENLPSLKTISANAFLNNQLTQLDLTGLPSLESIGESAFKNNPILDLVLDGLPNLKNIRTAAFEGTKIEDLTLTNLPELTSITGFNAIPTLRNVHLEGLPKLNSISGFREGAIESLTLKDLPSLTSILSSAFSGNKISSLTLENLSNLKTISERAFSDNEIAGELDLSTLPALETIGANAFSNNQITNVNFTGLNALKIIDQNAFIYNNIEKVEIKNLANLETIGLSSFANQRFSNLENSYNALQEVVLENLPKLKYLGGFADNYSNVKPTLSNLPSLEEILTIAFRRNAGSGTLDLSQFNSLKTIRENAFYAGPASTSNKYDTVLFPTSIENIHASAFFNNGIKNLDLSSLTNLKSIGNEAFNSGSAGNRLFKAETFALPATSTPIAIGKEVAYVDPSALDFRGTNVKLNLLSSKPFTVPGTQPLVMYFSDTSQVRWPSNIRDLDPSNPTILYIENYDGSLNPPAGILINPIKLTIKHVNDADGSPMAPGQADEVRYITADSTIDSGNFAGYRAISATTTPSAAGDAFHASDRTASVKYVNNLKEKELTFRYEPINISPANNWNLELDRITVVTPEFDVDTTVGLRATLTTPSSDDGESGTWVIQLPPHASSNPAHISYPKNLQGYPQSDVEASFDPIRKQVIYKIKKLQNNGPVSVDVGFKFDRLDTPQRIEEIGQSYFIASDGEYKTDIIDSPIFKPTYEVENGLFNTAFKCIVGSKNYYDISKESYVNPAPGSNGMYANHSETYEFEFYSQRRYAEFIIEDTLPTYSKYDDVTGSFLPAKATFDPAKNPGWVLSPDGTKVTYTLTKDVLDALIIQNSNVKFRSYSNTQNLSPSDETYPSYTAIRAALPKLILDYPKSKFNEKVENTAKFTGIPDQMAADDVIFERTRTADHTIWGTASVGGLFGKSSLEPQTLLSGTGDETSEYFWQVGLRSERVTVSDGTTNVTKDRLVKNIELWDYSLDGINHSNRLLEYTSVQPTHPAKIYFYKGTNPASSGYPAIQTNGSLPDYNKVRLDRLTLVGGPHSVAAGQKYVLSATERSEAHYVRVVYENVEISGPNEYVRFILGTGNKNGDPLGVRTPTGSNTSVNIFNYALLPLIP